MLIVFKVDKETMEIFNEIWQIRNIVWDYADISI